MPRINIPIGIENFETIRTEDCYYVDKTGFLVELLGNHFSVNLITRPRRFGKTLMMSMMENFFDIRKNSEELFKGLEVSKYKEICAKWMNQYPVIFMSFKDVAGINYQMAYQQFVYNISSLCMEHSYLLEQADLDSIDKENFLRLKGREVTEKEIHNSLVFLMRMMHQYYGKKVILLIDEYDVPLAKADEFGYYKDMLNLIRSIMSISLKTNPHLKFAVITGCLRIAKESIFTGANHFVNNSIENGDYLNAFGFTETEVRHMLKQIACEDKLPQIKRWYDGYQFGKFEMYCPWDIVNHISDLMRNPNAYPRNYWKDTSHNNIIRKFIGNESFSVTEKFEILLSGGSIQVQIRDDLTYDFDNSTEENLWSILYLTGYLTKEKDNEANRFTNLRIPNEEVKTIFEDTIADWFKDTMQTQNRDALFEAWWNGDTEKLTEMVSDILFDTISYYDYREDYYHAFLAGMFTGAGYEVTSNHEMGLGRTDICVKDRKHRRAMIIEVKRSANEEQIEKDCEKALHQIEEKQYVKGIEKGYRTILCYGVSFFEKLCLVKKL